MKQGDIIMVQFNPVSGHEQGNYRPALVVNRDDILLPGHLAIVIPITTKAKGYPLELPLPDGLNTRGYALPFHVRTLDLSSRKAKLIEHAPDDFVRRCCSFIAQLIEK